MRKFFMGLTLAVSVFAFSSVNNETQALKEAWEYGYGIWATYPCSELPGCDWARCEEGDGDCTYDAQHGCCIY